MTATILRSNGQLEAAQSRRPLPHYRVRRVVERMQHDRSQTLDLQTLASQSGYSTSHFLRSFSIAMGFTPHRFLLQLRIEKAKEMIRNGASSLLYVALECGFSSHAHLSRVFRQLLGMTPSEYRRQSRGAGRRAMIVDRRAE